MSTPSMICHLAALGWYFRKKIMLEQREIRMDNKISFTQMDEDDDLKNRVRV
jgi:hypothetical protein